MTTTMTTTINKVDDFLEAFPNKIVKHTGRPNYEILNNIKTALKRNFATVPCTLGGGTHGYLGAILTPAEYATATPINTPPFVDPPPPPPFPALRPSSHQIALDLKSPQSNVNLTNPFANGPNTRISLTRVKNSSKMALTTCT